MWMDEMREKEE